MFQLSLLAAKSKWEQAVCNSVIYSETQEDIIPCFMGLCLYMGCAQEHIFLGEGNPLEQMFWIQETTQFIWHPLQEPLFPKVCQNLDVIRLRHTSERIYNNICEWHLHQPTITCVCYKHESTPKSQILYCYLLEYFAPYLSRDTTVSLYSAEQAKFPSRQGSCQQVC